MTEPIRPASAAMAWVEARSKGWAGHDWEAIAERYAPDCLFSSHPFRPTARGRDAAAAWIHDAFADERLARFVFGDPIVSPDGRAPSSTGP